MGSSAKKKREKKQDFQKTKLKVGKARPKNTNATDTSFSAKSIVLKQQSLTETTRDAPALFDHNLSLLSSRNETQRKDALTYLTTVSTTHVDDLPRPAATVLSKAQPLALDGSASVRQQLIKLLKALPPQDLGSLDQTLLYTRAGMTHLSTDIRATSLDIMDWLLQTNGDAVVNCAGGWVKTLQTFQNLLSWQGTSSLNHNSSGSWTMSKTTSNNLGSNKLLVHQLTTLAAFLNAGLKKAEVESSLRERQRAAMYPLWQADCHNISRKNNPYNHLNLFGTPREVESEVYDDAEERAQIFNELGLTASFVYGVKEAKSLGGEVGRAAATVEKALRLVDVG